MDPSTEVSFWCKRGCRRICRRPGTYVSFNITKKLQIDNSLSFDKKKKKKKKIDIDSVLSGAALSSANDGNDAEANAAQAEEGAGEEQKDAGGDADILDSLESFGKKKKKSKKVVIAEDDGGAGGEEKENLEDEMSLDFGTKKKKKKGKVLIEEGEGKDDEGKQWISICCIDVKQMFGKRCYII